MTVGSLFKPSETTSLLSSENRCRVQPRMVILLGHQLIHKYTPILINDTDAEQALGANKDDGPLKLGGSGPEKWRPSSATVLKIVSVLLVGAFTSNGDSSLVLATHPTIASEFDCLSASSWLFVSFSLAGAATQTLYGKLSDIYGRRRLLIISYVLFAVGCALVGIGNSMGMVILGRVISGCGGSAMNVLGILIITDLVPIREVATWQSGVNLASTTGRSLGGPVGGWLADTVGWRWSFLGQVPLFLIAIGLCLAWLPGNDPAVANTAKAAPPKLSNESEDANNTYGQVDDHDADVGEIKSHSNSSSSLARLDIAGASFLALAILTLLLPLDIGGTQVPWTHPLIFALVGATVVLSGLFMATEAWWAVEPIVPVELLKHRDVLLIYFITASQGAAQLGLMFAVPLYFQVTQRVSNAVAGSYLVPAVAGNALGAILAGIVIKRTGRYKPLLVFATLASSASYLLLLLRWHGDTNVWESLYIFPAGLGTGIVQTATFVAVQAAIDPAHKAAAMSGNFLVVTIGGMAGMVAVNAVTVETMTKTLDGLLSAMDIGAIARHQIIEKAASNIDYIDEVGANISSAVVGSYVEGLSASHLVSLVGSLSAVLGALLMREYKM
ncbi:MFS general substrate transporter [Apiospora saccharicola]